MKEEVEIRHIVARVMREIAIEYSNAKNIDIKILTKELHDANIDIKKTA